MAIEMTTFFSGMLSPNQTKVLSGQ